MLEATLLALGAAVLHAGWNLLLKRSDERVITAWGFYLCGGLLMLPVLPFVDFPDGSALPYLAVSSLVHVAYILALSSAYHHGDFSLSYPLARGGGALLAAIGGAAFLGDDLSVWSWLAIAVVVGGLASLVRPGAGRDEHQGGREHRCKETGTLHRVNLLLSWATPPPDTGRPCPAPCTSSCCPPSRPQAGP